MQSYRTTLNKKFDEEYAKLNKEQRQAVDTIEGPVMVIAGPGTGKTQILAARIGRILMSTDALPSNILCLTYTDAGAVAMRRRLQQFIGPDAYKVSIHTFHSFCNDIIQENLSLFEKTALNPISDLEKIKLFKELIDTLPKGHLLKRYRGDVYYEISNLQHLFSVMKKEGWGPEHITGKIDQYIETLPDREEYLCKRATGLFKKGDVRTDKIQQERERMEKLCAAVNEFPRFQELMRKYNYYDFDDMINWVIKAFEENANLLAGYQERFHYILVDEYQDTSGTQNRIVQLLISYWESPNVFVVGDDDQSIFRFQGANIENLECFARSYADLLKIVLTHNYRSTQSILDVSKSLIDRNNERLIKKFDGYSKELISANEQISHLQHTPVIHEYNCEKDEMAAITLAVEQLISNGVPPQRIGIIYKENAYGTQLSKYFRLKDIPVYTKKSINLLEDPFARKVILILRYLAAEHDVPYGGDEMLFQILHFDFYNIPAIDIAKLTVEANDKQYTKEHSSLRRVVYEHSTKPVRTLFDKPADPRLKETSQALESLISAVPNVTLQQLFEKVIREAGVLSYVMKHPEKIALMQIVTALFDFLKEETARNPNLTLQDFVDVIDLMDKEGLALPLVQLTGSEKGVNLLTAHGAKGLEFQYVFIAGTNAHLWEKKNRRSNGYKFPDTLFSSLAVSSEEEELRRLFYVALTRAEQHLQISFARYRADSKPLEPSMFIAEILEQHHLEVQRIKVPDEDLMEFELLQFNEQMPEIEKIEEDFVAALLEKFSMNVTALNSYLRCPLEFYYRNLIRIPSGKSENTEFGSAVHYAIQRLFEKMQEKKSFPAREEMISDFKFYMKRHRENFTPDAFARRMEYGEDVLSSYYDKYIDTWNKVVAVEMNIKNVLIKNVPIKGKIDKLEFDGKQVNVVDYKTGKFEYAEKKLLPPSDQDPNGGDYWRQAVFYKILIDNYEQKDWKVISTEFDFVEPDKYKKWRKAKVVITPADIETVTQQITEVWEKVQQRDFYTGCGKPHCQWCNFVKENKLAVALHDVSEEEEEVWALK
jgi:DNA helicase II / ATP-dependent DNA helicase PcrA